MATDHPVGFHNVAELEPATGIAAGVTLRRFPKSVRDDSTLSRIGRHYTAHTSNGCEIRFVAPRALVRLYLFSPIPTRVFVLRGDFVYREGFIELRPGQITTITLEHPLTENQSAATFAPCRFAENVWRIHCLDAAVTFCGIESGDGPIRSPLATEQPKHRWLAYGSSITQSGEHYVGYLNTAAELLGVDALNLGMGGSCFLEASVASFIAHRNDWDFVTFELGINVLSHMSVEEFEKRARHLVTTVRQAQPQKHLFLITTFRNGLDYAVTSDPVWVEPCRRHREILREIVRETNSPRLHLIDGLAVFPDLTGFQADLLHPGVLAATRAGERLAGMIREKVSLIA